MEAYRQLLAPEEPRTHPWLKGGALLAVLGVSGWLWRQKAGTPPSRRDPSQEI